MAGCTLRLDNCDNDNPTWGCTPSEGAGRTGPSIVVDSELTAAAVVVVETEGIRDTGQQDIVGYGAGCMCHERRVARRSASTDEMK